MTSRNRMFATTLLALLVTAAAGATTVAAEQQAPQPERPALKVEVVLTRSQGEKKVSNVPYSILVGGGFTRLRVGVDVPGDPSSTTSKEGVTTTRRDSRFVGTSIDAAANPRGPGRHELVLSISDSSVLPDQRSKEPGQVAFRTFSISNTLVVVEGQPLAFVVGTDQVTGETLRAEVTVTVVK